MGGFGSKASNAAKYNSVLDIGCHKLLDNWNATPVPTLRQQVPGAKKAYLFVNVASKWGLTDRDYKQLVQMHKELKADGFEIMAFPCNQFGGQEPGTAEEINEFIRGKYGAEFQIFEKIDVNGENAHPVYKYLRSNSSLFDAEKNVVGEIQWNFAKFLVDGNGHVK